jgi:hypothetical protein
MGSADREIVASVSLLQPLCVSQKYIINALCHLPFSLAKAFFGFLFRRAFYGLSDGYFDIWQLCPDRGAYTGIALAKDLQNMFIVLVGRHQFAGTALRILQRQVFTYRRELSFDFTTGHWPFCSKLTLFGVEDNWRVGK